MSTTGKTLTSEQVLQNAEQHIVDEPTANGAVLDVRLLPPTDNLRARPSGNSAPRDLLGTGLSEAIARGRLDRQSRSSRSGKLQPGQGHHGNGLATSKHRLAGSVPAARTRTDGRVVATDRHHQMPELAVRLIRRSVCTGDPWHNLRKTLSSEDKQ